MVFKGNEALQLNISGTPTTGFTDVFFNYLTIANGLAISETSIEPSLDIGVSFLIPTNAVESVSRAIDKLKITNSTDAPITYTLNRNNLGTLTLVNQTTLEAGTSLYYDSLSLTTNLSGWLKANGEFGILTYPNLPVPSFTVSGTGFLKGDGAGGATTVSGTQTTSYLDVFTSVLKGLAPASGGGTTAFLRADGTWAVPPGGGGGGADLTNNTEEDSTYVYYAFAPVGSSLASSVWRVFRRDKTTQAITKADGNNNYDNIGQTLSTLIYS